MAVDRTRIVQAALQILNDYGFADLSMRRIAEELGVQASAIYYHYANKQTLLAAVSDAILTGLAVGSGNWDEQLAAWLGELRQRLLTHRDGADLVSSALASGLSRVHPSDVIRPALRAAGWGERAAATVTNAVVHFVLGHVSSEQSRQQLVELGALPSDTDPFDAAGFTGGVELLLAGARAIGPT